MKFLEFVWKYRLQVYAEGNKLYAEGNKLYAEGDKLYAEGDKLRAEGDKLWAEGNKLWAEGDKLRAEGDKLWAEGNKLRAEGNKLWAEGNKLWAEGDKLWAEAIIEIYGNIKIEWKNWHEKEKSYECHLENGIVYNPSEIIEPRDEEVDKAIKLLESKGRIVNGKIVKGE